MKTNEITKMGVLGLRLLSAFVPFKNNRRERDEGEYMKEISSY